jgi:hypothetical protein
VFDHDFINDTIENVLTSATYENIDFLTGVTLHEGLYFAEYHIKHLYGSLMNQTDVKTRTLSNDKHTKDSVHVDISKQTQTIDTMLNHNWNGILEKFARLDYIKHYIQANFKQDTCFLDDVKNRYDASTRT